MALVVVLSLLLYVLSDWDWRQGLPSTPDPLPSPGAQPAPTASVPADPPATGPIAGAARGDGTPIAAAEGPGARGSVARPAPEAPEASTAPKAQRRRPPLALGRHRLRPVLQSSGRPGAEPGVTASDPDP
jgi:hypothetical protein